MRMQVADGTSVSYSSLRNSLSSVLKHEGYKGLYGGMSAGLIASTCSWGGYFYFYEWSKRRKLAAMGLNTNNNDNSNKKLKLGPKDHMLAGIEAGSIMVLLFNPMWLIKTRLALQGAQGLNAATTTSTSTLQGTQYKGILNTVRTIVKEEGFIGLYQGVIPALILTSHGAVQFTAYEYMKVTIQEYFDRSGGNSNGSSSSSGPGPGPNQSQSAWVSVLLGGTSKIIASTVTYPYQVLKSRLQQRGSGKQYIYSGVYDCAKTTWVKEGIKGFFRGFVPGTAKVVPASALTFVVYEEMLKLFK